MSQCYKLITIESIFTKFYFDLVWFIHLMTYQRLMGYSMLKLFLCKCFSTITTKGCPRGVMVKAMNCGIVVREFVLQSRYYVHFRANTLGKGMKPLILPPAMGK